ncbi:Putative rRNA methylase [Selenomonas sp. GACV-9]|uniref:class I SAM-dependent methyltransferase n=1 Tax=Selenomonas sp. GACV-9 TaxID=3158782 RepID=UPI0008ED5A25|nr:Putative rRNA methylase [Selenomonas ruminantium]
MQTVSNVLELMHLAIVPVLGRAENVVDATAGNGHDTLFLAENTPASAHIYAFDIQPQAIANTKVRTEKHASRISYILDSHEHLGEHVHEPIDVILFNLGYLPGAEHTAVTRQESTEKAVEQALEKLKVNGLAVVVVYPGHPEGKVEADMLATYFASLPCRIFTVGCYRLVNHKETAPYAYVIERVRSTD